jgi:hypothetical protein
MRCGFGHAHQVIRRPNPPVSHHKVAIVDAEIMRGKHVHSAIYHTHVRVSQADAGQNDRVAADAAFDKQRKQSDDGDRGHGARNATPTWPKRSNFQEERALRMFGRPMIEWGWAATLAQCPRAAKNLIFRPRSPGSPLKSGIHNRRMLF